MAKRYNVLTRCLAALALLFVYVASTSAILVGATTSPAQAWRGGGRGWGRGGGWGRGVGWGRGRGYGRGYGYYGGVVVGPRCWWNVYGVRVCRYY
jgi:hypothetical protein